ncbi:hypothetical protein C8F04DRAFT_163689 [Mycena alexandri]|uniref:Uncharacterized protein n=1 Tax=Mycena alexandri TaxID=1745969 RepID=A0AAD6WUT8_9AGAR|nr:hypothetical protein C8F04DRAFT_163689 [Mycena alexandri]
MVITPSMNDSEITLTQRHRLQSFGISFSARSKRICTSLVVPYFPVAYLGNKDKIDSRLLMASFLTLFCCCGQHHRARDDDIVDETSHLIPSNVDPTPPTVVFTDYQRIQERLITIVRAKERKMVNVNSQIPFNLHNRVITKPSLSRSVSLSAGGLPDHANIVASTFDAREPLTVQLRSPPSPLGSANGRNASHSQSRSISLSRDPDEIPPKPILNVRLVNTFTSNLPQRVGRPRHRAYGSPSSTEYPRPPETRTPEDPTPLAISPADAPPQEPSNSTPRINNPLDEICLSWGDSDS